MMNLFHADFYRLRKSASFRNTIIGLILLILLVATPLKFVTSNGLVVMLDEYAGDNLSPSEWEEIQRDMEELRTVEETATANAAGFINQMLSSNFVAFFFLPMLITIFAADFTTGAARNTLSYHSNRNRIYLAKLLLSIVSCLILTAVSLLTSWLVGGLYFGLSGVTSADISRILMAQLLLLPTQLGVLGFGHCIIAYTKKSSSTIAIYLLTLTFSSVVLQLLQNFSFSVAGRSISFEWIGLLDWNGASALLINYPSMKVTEILFVMVGGLGIAALTTALGMTRFKRSDIA